MTPQQIQAKINAAESEAIARYKEGWGDGDYIIRALLPSDFNSVTVEEWQETTGTAIDAWNASTVAPGTTLVRDNTVLGIYGIKVITGENEAGVYAWGAADVSAPVTAVRLTAGGARLAQWDFSFLFHASAQTASLATTSAVYGPLQDHPAGFAASPIVIRGPKAVTIAYWEVTASLDFQIAWLGVVVEAAGGQGGITTG